VEELKDRFRTHPLEFKHSTRPVQADDDDDDDGDDTENAALREAGNGSRRTGRISTTQNEIREELMFQT